MVSLRDNRVLIGKPNGFGLYGGYTDNGAKYRMSYRSAYIDLQAHTTNKMLKRASIVVIGGGGQEFNILIGYDYKGDLWSYPYRIDDNGIRPVTRIMNLVDQNTLMVALLNPDFTANALAFLHDELI
jgi:hypothetical protein